MRILQLVTVVVCLLHVIALCKSDEVSVTETVYKLVKIKQDALDSKVTKTFQVK